jgi:hypothetical protein
MKNKISVIKNFFNVTSTTFKATMLIVALIYLPIIFKLSLTWFNTTDVIPQMKAINTEVLKKLGPFTVRIKSGMFIKNFPVFDINKNTFLIDAMIWFEFNGDEIMLETIEKFSFDNGKITYKSPPDIKISNEQIFVKYNVLFELKTDLNFHKFPFEDHRIPIVMSNDFVTPDEMIFVVDASAFQLRPNIAPAGWRFKDTAVDTGFLPLQLDRQDESKKAESPKALFILNVAKASARKALIIFIPLFSAAFLSLLSFLINAANIGAKISLAITAVTALLGYRFVIEQMMPQVGYFTTTDAIYLFLLIFSFICFSVQLLLTRRYMVNNDKNKENEIEALEKINGIIFIVMLLLLVAVTTYIILT